MTVHAANAGLARVEHGNAVDVWSELERVVRQEDIARKLLQLALRREHAELLSARTNGAIRILRDRRRHHHVHQVDLIAQVHFEEQRTLLGGLRVRLGHCKLARRRHERRRQRDAHRLQEATPLRHRQRAQPVS